MIRTDAHSIYDGCECVICVAERQKNLRVGIPVWAMRDRDGKLLLVLLADK